MDRARQEREILELALKAGQILLENGAEIFRVEDTVHRICHHFGLNTASAFVLSNGIFLTAGDEEETQFAKVKQIPVNHANLTMVVEVNQLSRRIETGECTLEEAKRELHRIQNLPGYSNRFQILAGSVVAASFCYIFKGNWQDMICSLFIGALFYVYQLYIGKRYFKRIVNTILGSALITTLSIICYLLHLGTRVESMMIGGIILMVPGVAFTNAIRDIGNGDYISGAVRMIDALLAFFCIAMGVGFALAAYHALGGTLIWL